MNLDIPAVFLRLPALAFPSSVKYQPYYLKIIGLPHEVAEVHVEMLPDTAHNRDLLMNDPFWIHIFKMSAC